MAIYPMQDGVRKEVKQLFVHDDGLYKEASEQWVKDGGLWKQVYSSGPPEIGEPWEGGYYLADFGGYQYIIADKSAEASLQWKTTLTETSGASSTTDGWANTNEMNDSSHPAAQYCRAYRGGGFDDWFLPAKDELNLFWLSLAPGSSGTPEIFKTGGLQALNASTDYWSSTQISDSSALSQRFGNGDTRGLGKTFSVLVRPVRKIIL